MTTNRFFSVFGLFAMALMAAIVLVLSLTVSGLKIIPIGAAIVPAGVSAPNPVVAEQARLEQRRGEWTAGLYNPYAALDLHDRHAAVAEPVALEFQRYEWYHGQPAEVTDLHDRHPSGAAAEPVALEFQRYQWYHGQGSAAALAEQVRLEQRRGEWAGK